MNVRVTIYAKDTGIVLRCMTVPKRAIAPNVRQGEAWIEGHLDKRSQRVDVATGAVVAYQRPASEIEAEQRAARDRLARQRIAELERAQHRPLRELAIDPANAEAKKRLTKIDEEIAALRVR